MGTQQPQSPHRVTWIGLLAFLAFLAFLGSDAARASHVPQASNVAPVGSAVSAVPRISRAGSRKLPESSAGFTTAPAFQESGGASLSEAADVSALENSLITPQGRAVLDRCQSDLAKTKGDQGSLKDLGPTRKWDTLSRFHNSKRPAKAGYPNLGWVETWGTGVEQARVNEDTCFLLAVRTSSGQLFDRGCFQRASFFGNMSSVTGTVKLHVNTPAGPIRLAADVTYVPSQSMHRVCYSAPTPGQYRLQLSLMFTNTFLVTTSINPKLASGYTNYAPVVATVVHVAGSAGSYSLFQHRRSTLPVCTVQALTESGNRGFWIGGIWLPLVCRLRRLSPFQAMKLLNGKSTLFLGDSEMRYLFGVLQVYLSMRSRASFLSIMRQRVYWSGSALEHQPVPRGVSGPWGDVIPTLLPASNRFPVHQYKLSTGNSTFFGGKYSGICHQHLQMEATIGKGPEDPSWDQINVDLNLTYVTFFGPKQGIFRQWMRNASFAGEAVVSFERQFDLVVEGSLLHSVPDLDSIEDYRERIQSTFLPQIGRVCPPGNCSHVSFGPLTGIEHIKPWRFVHMSNNLRNSVFEEEAHRLFQNETLSQGSPSRHFLPMRHMTGPVRASEFSGDGTHFRAPVNLAMLDLVLGSICPDCPGSLI